MKKQIKTKKRMLLYSILALTIGIATILPLSYLTLRDDTNQKPISSIGMILYAHAVPTTHINNGVITNRQTVNLLTNFTLNPDTATTNLKDVDAQIEIYNFHIYSDKASIANITYSISICKLIPTNSTRGYNSTIQGSGAGFWIFNDGTKFDIKDVLGYTEGTNDVGFRVGRGTWSEENGYSYSSEVDRTLQRGYFVGSSSAILSEINGDEKSVQASINIKNAQTLYIDTTRVMTVTYKSKLNSSDSTAPATSSITTATMDSNKVIGHIELAKTDWGFASGSVPDLMQNDSYYRYILPPSEFLNPYLPKEEQGYHAGVIDFIG
jgi:hypothetical protein